MYLLIIGLTQIGFQGEIIALSIDIVPNRQAHPAVLRRAGWRGGRGRQRPLASLTAWPPGQVAARCRVRRGKRLVAAKDAFTVERSAPHGPVARLLALVRRLGLERRIAPPRCPARARVVVERGVRANRQAALPRARPGRGRPSHECRTRPLAAPRAPGSWLNAVYVQTGRRRCLARARVVGDPVMNAVLDLSLPRARPGRGSEVAR